MGDRTQGIDRERGDNWAGYHIQRAASFGKGGPKLFTPWMALQDQELAEEE
jgi:hypothetical protein